MSVHIVHLTQTEHRLLQFIKVKLHLSELSDEDLISHLRDCNLKSISGLLQKETKIIETFLTNIPPDAGQLVCITDKESALLQRLEKVAREKNLSIWEFISQITLEDFSNQPGIGKKKVELLGSLKKKSSALASASVQNTPQILLQSPDSLLEAEKAVIEHIESLLATSDPAEQTLIKSKLGYSASKRTLKELGAELGVSESRCSQILTRIEQRLRFSKVFPDSYLDKFSSENKFKNPKEIFPTLSAKFTDTQGFVTFLRLVMNQEPMRMRTLNLAEACEIKKGVICDIFSDHNFPMGLEVFYEAYLHRTSTRFRDYWHTLARAMDDGLIRIQNHSIVWADLSLPATIANVLATSHDGLSLSDLSEKLTKLTGENITNEHLLRSCRKNDYIFQSGRYFFTHRKYFDASIEEIEQVRTLISANEADSEHQTQDIYSYLARQNALSNIDPYTFAEIYRRLADDSSRNLIKFQNLSAVSRSDRKNQILALFNDRNDGLTCAEIAETTGLAESYVHRLLTELVNELQITRTSKIKYQANATLLAGIDTQAIRQALERELSELGKISEAGFVAQRLNHKLGLQAPKETYLTIAKIPGNTTIHVTRNLMSMHAIPFHSLRDLVGSCLTPTTSDNDIIAAVKDLVHLTEDVLQSIRFQVLPLLRSIHNKVPRVTKAS